MNDVIDQREFEQLFDLQWQDDSDGLAGPIEETMPVEQGSDNSSKEERVVLNKRKEWLVSTRRNKNDAWIFARNICIFALFFLFLSLYNNKCCIVGIGMYM